MIPEGEDDFDIPVEKLREMVAGANRALGQPEDHECDLGKIIAGLRQECRDLMHMSVRLRRDLDATLDALNVERRECDKWRQTFGSWHCDEIGSSLCREHDERRATERG